MTSRRALALSALLTGVLTGLALGGSAAAAPTVPRVMGALTVTWSDSAFGPPEMAVAVSEPAGLGPGEIVINGFGNWISVAPGTGGPLLTPGQGCRFEVPAGQSAADYPLGTSIVCGFGVWSSIRINLQGSTYSGGDLLFASNANLGTSFRGSDHSDEFYGGPGSDSVDGAGGDDAIFGGDGDDWLLGGDGADTIDGEGGSDVVYGDAGADTITVDEDGEADWVNCNNFDRAVQNTDNDPDNPPINRVFADKGLDRVTDCGVAAAPVVKTYPAVSGTPVTGQPFTAQAGTWEGKGLLLSYAWFACPTPTSAIPFLDDDEAGDCTEVAARDGDRGLAYTPKASDTGRYLVLRATARNNSGFAVAVSGYSGAVKATPLTPGPVRNLSATSSVARENGKRTLTIEVTWARPLDVGPGVKEYVIEITGVATPVVFTAMPSYTLKLAPYPKRAWIDIVVSAQGPKGSSQRGSASRTAVRTPAR